MMMLRHDRLRRRPSAAAPHAAAHAAGNVPRAAALREEAQCSRSAKGTPVAFKSLPSELRVKLGTPDKAQVWQVGADEHLLLQAQLFGAESQPEVYAASPPGKSPFRGTGDAVARRTECVDVDMEDEAVTRQWWLPDARLHGACIEDPATYTVLQVNWLSRRPDRRGNEKAK